MFERFTGRARRVIVLAQEEARELGHDYIGTEHLLLGLLGVRRGLGARVLESMGITAERVRAQVVRIVGSGEELTNSSGQIPFTPPAKKVLELAVDEAQGVGVDHIDTEHVLLGLVREDRGVASRILLDFDADAETIRGETTRLLAEAGHPDAGGRQRGRRRRRGGGRAVGHAPAFVAWLGQALVAAASEAHGEGDRAVDDGDLLLALAGHGEGVAANALADLGVDEHRLREAVRRARRPHDASGGGDSDSG